ncbi:hypothetical protein [Tropicimonas sediminicola]|uniref:Uncharacterized protein n=1 Tax=Tropicimonas sediminicola TaxID=1031541 RepID=A0A239CM20_9RHOB|nr:hypothetical protein [Tropicimonas sediminicola]SNS20932.1 hypothetical protein SAMN05421757_101354 [Tropicimonas sediminicola]
MYARITPYKLKPGSREAATRIVHELKPRIMALPGMQRFTNVLAADGSGYVVALTTEPEMTPEVQEKVKALWGALGEHLEAIPAATSCEVIVDWST